MTTTGTAPGRAVEPPGTLGRLAGTALAVGLGSLVVGWFLPPVVAAGAVAALSAVALSRLLDRRRGPADGGRFVARATVLGAACGVPAALALVPLLGSPLGEPWGETLAMLMTYAVYAALVGAVLGAVAALVALVCRHVVVAVVVLVVGLALVTVPVAANLAAAGGAEGYALPVADDGVQAFPSA